MAAFTEEFSPRRTITVCNERQARIVDGIEILPWRRFLDELRDTGLGVA